MAPAPPAIIHLASVALVYINSNIEDRVLGFAVIV